MACSLLRPFFNSSPSVGSSVLEDILLRVTANELEYSKIRKNLKNSIESEMMTRVQPEWFPNAETTDIFLDFCFQLFKPRPETGLGAFFPSVRLQEVSPKWMNYCTEKFKEKGFPVSYVKTDSHQNLEYFEMEPGQETMVNFHLKIEEPKVGSQARSIKPSIYLVPCWIADQKFNRIGRGRGFFDRYIQKVRASETENAQRSLFVGLVHPQYLVSEIPGALLHDGDQKLDGILTSDSLTLSTYKLEKN